MQPEQQPPIDPMVPASDNNMAPPPQAPTQSPPSYSQQPAPEVTGQNQVPTLDQSMAGGQPPKKSKTGLIIAIVAVVSIVVLIFAGIFFMIVSSSVSKIQKDAASIEEQNKINESNSKSNAVTAKNAVDYNAVCDGGSILNAPAPVKPYLIESFFTNETKPNDRWSSINVGYGESYHPESSNPLSANVVACLEQKKDTEVKRKTCDFKESADKVVSIDFYSVEYELTYKEARTGEVIGSPTPINGPATTCPLFVSYSKTDPKIYADPDKVAIEASHKAFAK